MSAKQPLYVHVIAYCEFYSTLYLMLYALYTYTYFKYVSPSLQFYTIAPHSAFVLKTTVLTAMEPIPAFVAEPILEPRELRAQLAQQSRPLRVVAAVQSSLLALALGRIP